MSWYSTGIRCHLNHDCTGGDKVIALFDAAEHFHLLAVVHAKSDGILHVAVFIEAYIDEEVALFFGYSLNGSDYTSCFTEPMRNTWHKSLELPCHRW